MGRASSDGFTISCSVSPRPAAASAWRLRRKCSTEADCSKEIPSQSTRSAPAQREVRSVRPRRGRRARGRLRMRTADSGQRTADSGRASQVVRHRVQNGLFHNEVLPAGPRPGGGVQSVLPPSLFARRSRPKPAAGAGAAGRGALVIIQHDLRPQLPAAAPPAAPAAVAGTPRLTPTVRSPRPPAQSAPHQP